MIYSEQQNKLFFNKCKLKYNRADIGGAICLLVHSKLNITGENCFIGNLASSGGVIYARESTVYINSQTVLMANNLVTDKGGAMHVSRSNLTFFNGTTKLVQNIGYNGGALYAHESKIDIYNESLLITKSTARDTGGAMYISKGNLSLTNCNSTFLKNEATTGGALSISESQIIFFGGNSNFGS